ncbi:hypothetical protein NP493_359g11002 [Ridgeia piscesae]|uniref:UspA domain-containing protein n=1 Tax=Ridgeia piscesae TaxID=27915 RepID=A0AAD9NTJ7_RIDPI|nr:hypothetical protein NP493_359g11002 [Ridgeia piscesae]
MSMSSRACRLVLVEAIYMSGELWAEMSAKEEAKVKSLKQKYKHKMAEAKLEGAIRSSFSSKPGEAIVKMAEAEKAAMIVMGTRGMGTIRRTILGSVSDYVVHHAGCPVVVCRSGAES